MKLLYIEDFQLTKMSLCGKWTILRILPISASNENNKISGIDFGIVSVTVLATKKHLKEEGLIWAQF